MSDNDLLPRRVVPLIDPDTGKEIPMEVFLEVDVDMRVYALLTPAEWEVEVVRASDESIEAVEPSELPGLKKHIAEGLAQWGITVHLQDDQLFLKGDPPEAFFDECDSIDVNTEDGEEEYAILLQLDTGDEEFLVIMPNQPELFPVELVDGKGRALEDDELERLEDTFRRALEVFDDDDDDDGGDGEAKEP